MVRICQWGMNSKTGAVAEKPEMGKIPSHDRNQSRLIMLPTLPLFYLLDLSNINP